MIAEAQMIAEAHLAEAHLDAPPPSDARVAPSFVEKTTEIAKVFVV